MAIGMFLVGVAAVCAVLYVVPSSALPCANNSSKRGGSSNLKVGLV